MQTIKDLKKVLIITYYWPPAGGPGVQRWLKFAKYLPSFGYQPVIYTPENANYPILDKQLIDEVYEHCIIVKTPIREPYRLANLLGAKKAKTMSSGIIKFSRKQSFAEKLMLWIRGNFFIPDARVGWVKPSVNFLVNYVQKHNIDTVITTGPPHSMHLIGMKLQELCNLHWIADFRDPWTTIGYHKELKLTAFAIKKHLELERAVLNKADQIIVTSKTTKSDFQKLTQKPIKVITNGYDVEYLGKVELDDAFTISHIGSFLSNRNPRVFWKALAELRKENKAFKAAFQLKLVGRVSNEILDAIREFHLDSCTINVGYVDHKQALIEQRKARVLLLIEIDSEETRAIIPGKLFEYMAAERPILAIGPEQADFFEIIKETNTGKVALYDQKEEIKEILLSFFKSYQEGTLKVYGMGLQYYSRKKLTESLAKLLETKNV